MIRILFVCLGNICRSPMAEFVFKDMVKKEGLEESFYIKSAGTSNEEEGNRVHYGTVQKLKEVGVEVDYKKKATQFKKSDYELYDYIICMEQRNINSLLKFLGHDKDNKIFKLLDFTNNPRDISDPWYSGNFDLAYNDILYGCKGLLSSII